MQREEAVDAEEDSEGLLLASIWQKGKRTHDIACESEVDNGYRQHAVSIACSRQSNFSSAALAAFPGIGIPRARRSSVTAAALDRVRQRASKERAEKCDTARSRVGTARRDALCVEAPQERLREARARHDRADAGCAERSRLKPK